MQKVFTDELGNQITVRFPPKRIVSIVPSQTELLFDLGLNEELVGVTKFCIHPKEKTKSIAKIGGTKNLNIAEIRKLQPDLIIGNKEENNQQHIELLQKEFPVWMSDIYNLEDAIKTISAIGTLVNKEPEAQYINHLINAGFRDLQSLALSKKIDKTVLYAIWRNPYMFAGRQTFIADVLTKIGLNNLVIASRYPELTVNEIVELNPDFVFLSSEPYPFSEKHVAEIHAMLPRARILLVDGEMFSWYGSRLVKAVQYFFEFQNKLTEN